MLSLALKICCWVQTVYCANTILNLPITTTKSTVYHGWSGCIRLFIITYICPAETIHKPLHLLQWIFRCLLGQCTYSRTDNILSFSIGGNLYYLHILYNNTVYTVSSMFMYSILNSLNRNSAEKYSNCFIWLLAPGWADPVMND